MCRESWLPVLSNIKLDALTAGRHRACHSMSIATIRQIPAQPMPSSPDPPPFRLLRLDHVVPRVADTVRSIAFYAQALGCTVVRRRDDLGLVHLRAGASMIDLVAVDGPLGREGGAAATAQGSNLDHLCLRVDPFDEASLMRHLTAAGAPPLAPVTTRFGAEGDGPSLYFREPDGNTIERKGASPP